MPVSMKHLLLLCMHMGAFQRAIGLLVHPGLLYQNQMHHRDCIPLRGIYFQRRTLELKPPQAKYQTARKNEATEEQPDPWDPENPFAQGAFRWVNKGTYTRGERAGQKCVEKWFKSGVVFEEEFYATDIHAVQKAEKIITRWNDAGFIDQTIFLNIPEVWAEQAKGDPEEGPWTGQKVLVEPFIEDWRKFNSNSGWTGKDAAWPRVMQALSHYSYDISSGECVLCDLQGGFYSGGVVLSDPVILSRKKEYGVTDLGKSGISTFFSRHRCNEFCRAEWSKPRQAIAYFPAQQGTTMVASHNALPKKAALTTLSNIQAYADQAAARTPAEKEVEGKNKVKVVSAVKKALGGSALVLDAGSIKKNVDIARSDLDLFVDTGDHPVTHDQKQFLMACLKKEFPDAGLLPLHYACIRIAPAQGRDIDVVLRHIPGKIKPMPREHFLNNTGARTAIRAFKSHLANQGKKATGCKIENEVIQFTQLHPGCNADVIYKHLMGVSFKLKQLPKSKG